MALTSETLPEIQAALVQAGLDGWLLFDFHGSNPIAGGMLGLRGMVTRRVFGWIPARGNPIAITHAIEQGPWRDWPSAWEKRVYSSWRSLEQHVRECVGGKKVAMEYSPGDAVPYVDRIPAGVLEMVRTSGGVVISSGELISRFFARWSTAQASSHDRAAKVIAGIAREAMARAGDRARDGKAIAEHELQEWILQQFERAGLERPDHGPIVAIGPNAANPHYAPSSSRPVPIVAGSMLLIDLWAREPNGVYADQTWMGSLGAPNSRAVEVWTAVREGRDAAIELGKKKLAAGEPLTGAELDDAARGRITAHGLEQWFTHRTGHSIDPQDLHGAGPHIDNLETREERRLIDGVGFSIEPGVYLPGELGVRSEVNARVHGRELIVTPADYQRELLVV